MSGSYPVPPSAIRAPNDATNQQGVRRPEASQSAARIRTMAEALVRLEEKAEDAEDWERCYRLKMDVVRGWTRALKGHRLGSSAAEFPEGRTLEEARAALKRDQDRCTALVEEVSSVVVPLRKHPAVTVATGDGTGPAVYSIDPGDRTHIETLENEYTETKNSIIRTEREAGYEEAWKRLLPKLSEVEGLAAKWGLYDMTSKFRDVEVTNSVERLESLVAREKTRIVAQQREAEASDTRRGVTEA